MLLSKDARLGFKGYIDSYIKQYFNNDYLLEISGVYDYLYTRLYNAAVRTLVKEMHILKGSKVLKGNSANDRYDYFEKFLEKEENRTEIEKKYPVLKENMIRIARSASNYLGEVVSDFNNDLPYLQEKFDSRICKIVNISIGEGDTHNGGKSVVVVMTNSVKLVYKPHSFDGDYVFENVIEWINSRKLSHNLKVVKFYSRGEHGWQEYIEHDGNLNEKQAKDYYYRCGELLFLFFLLGSTDMHFQNIIVNKSFPMLIDLETLVSMPRCIEAANVLETAYLPRIMKNDINIYDFDVSGLCASGNFYSGIKSISIVDGFTDKMRIENVAGYISETKNCVYVDGNKVTIENYDQYVIKGFEELWRIIEKNKKEFVEYIDNLFYEHNFSFRQILRSTQVYYKFLVAASHPDFLKDYHNRDNLFDKLKNGISDKSIIRRIENEIEQMQVGDVPYYCVKYDSKDLFSCNKIVCKDYFENTIRDGMHSRVEQINENLLVVQTDIIRKSIFTAYKNQYADACSREPIKEDEYITNTALEIKKCCINNGTNFSLIINTLSKGRYSLDILNLDMFEGGGIIWYLACVGYQKDIPEYINLAYNLFQSAEKYWDMQIKEVNSKLSAFFGEGSILYLLANLVIIDKQNNYEQYFEKYLKSIIFQIENKEDFSNVMEVCSYLNGCASVLVVFCKLYQKNKKLDLEHSIRILKEVIASHLAAGKCDKKGFFDGISGLVYALTMADYTLEEYAYSEIVRSMLYTEYKGLIADESCKDCSVKSGWSGMIFARVFAYNYYKEKVIIEQVNKMYECLQKDIRVYGFNNNILEGRRGIKEILGDVEHILPSGVSSSFCVNEVGEYDEMGLFNRHKIENFMTGTAGIAYSYLRNLNKKLPSIIVLDLYSE